MAIDLARKKGEEIGSWQMLFKRTCSERVKKAIKRAVKVPEICLEHARAEMKVFEQYKNEPIIIQRARLFETYLREKSIYILEGELIVGNVSSKVRGSPIHGALMSTFLDAELDDPILDPAKRARDWHNITDAERKELRQVILPYFKGKTIEDFQMARVDGETREHSFESKASCPHIPIFADLSIQKDAGHQMPNWEKVLYKGLKGIRAEVEQHLTELDQPYMHFELKAKRDFYRACLIMLDAGIAYAARYAKLAREMAAKESNPKRKAELQKIAETCDWVPANPARNWWEALQSVWFINVLLFCEHMNLAASFGRFDQYMFPFYKKSVIDSKAMTRDEALELLECFWVKTCEHTCLWSYFQTQTQPGQPMSQNLLIGGQTRDGKDAVNEVSYLCLEAEEQVGLIQPEIAARIWEGTPHEFLKRCGQVVRLGRGKLKFYGDRKGIQMVAKAYPGLSIEDYRDYTAYGCVEINLSSIGMQHSLVGLQVAPKVLELTLNNGKCPQCGKQIGPTTGDPRTFESMAGVREAFRKQMFFWTEWLTRGMKSIVDGQAEVVPAPFSSCLLEGPLQKGKDLIQGGAWFTTFGIFLGGLANTGDSLAVIDKLIYKEKKMTWNQLLEALKDNWKGHEELRQLCLNDVPKFGNDNDYADDWLSFVLDTYADTYDWANTQKELLPAYGGKWTIATIIGIPTVALGGLVGATPDGRMFPNPFADTLSPTQGADRNGPTAVLKSNAKLPTHRMDMGTCLNQRLNPQLMATDRDLDNWVAFMRSWEQLGIYQIQFNVISTDLLRKAMKEPDNYRDLLVRVASYCSYFTELDEGCQMDIINRSEQGCY